MCAFHDEMGSSPHTRGARTRSHPAWRRLGIIPAYAGSTICELLGEEVQEDHPRIRGEHAKVESQQRHIEGSSPHTRGARGFVSQKLVEHGIIPAYAGSTS